MAIREVVKKLAGTEDFVLGEGTVEQKRQSGPIPITKVGAASLPYDDRSPDIRSIKDELLVKVRKYSTQAAMVADVANVVIEDLCFTAGIASGDQQGTWWEAVDATTVTANAINILVGNPTVSFKKLNSVGLVATTAQLVDIAHPINTVGKQQGLQVFNTTTNKPVYATGTAAATVWVDASGATTHAPS